MQRLWGLILCGCLCAALPGCSTRLSHPLPPPVFPVPVIHTPGGSIHFRPDPRKLAHHGVSAQDLFHAFLALPPLTAEELATPTTLRVRIGDRWFQMDELCEIRTYPPGEKPHLFRYP